MRGFSNTIENNFTRGLITEYSAMNFPENAITEGDNCIFHELGTVSRRVGVDFESNGTVIPLNSITPNIGSYTEYVWFAVDNDGTITFIVQQVGDKLIFFTNDGENALTPNKKTFSVSLSSFKVAGVTTDALKNSICRYTSGKGYLFVSNPLCDPFVVSYNFATDSISTSRIEVKVRDFELIEDGTSTIDERPSALTNTHHYNLFNQGWYFIEDGENVITQWKNYTGSYPSNSDVWWVYKNADEDFRPSRSNNISTGNTPAPSGHYIYNAWNIDRTSVSGIGALPSVTSGKARPSVLKFYAGRIFYGGVAASKYSNQVFYSQVIESDDQFGKCYQANDPTSETTYDLLDTDGGVVNLNQIESIVDLRVLGDSLLIFGTNAIVAIRGNDNGPFRATNFTIEFVSNVGINSPLSVVEVENTIIWWNNEGIYSITKDQVGINFQVGNISKESIQTFFNSIPSINRQYIKGAYNKRDKIVRWVLSDNESLTGFNYNRILDLNVISKAFYTHTVDTTLAPRISGIFSVAGSGLNIQEVDVVHEGNSNRVISGGINVISSTIDFLPNVDIFKFTTTGNISGSSPGLIYSELSNTDYVDWYSYDNQGVSFKSYGISGYRIRGELLKSFNSSVVSFVMRRDENQLLLIHGIWNYGEKTTSGQQVYKDNPNLDYVIRRVKLRGKGKSLQFKFENIGNAPFYLVGWSTFETGGTLP